MSETIPKDLPMNHSFIAKLFYTLVFECSFNQCRVREMLTFFNKTIAKRTPPGQRQSVQNEGGCVRNEIFVN